MGTVTGTVKADGKPLANATVTFYPQPTGRPSSGKTDENGQYKLIYSADENGAIVGEHQVRISTADDGGDYGKSKPETLPSKYNIATELKKEVKPGKNVIDFDLDYKGKIIKTAY